ncbi:MAG: ribonuclease Y, partial [Candidatus Cloacimonadota bacterium]
MNINIISLAIGLFVGIGLILVIYFIKKNANNKKILNSSELAKKIIADAKQEAETLKKTTILEAKEK